MQIRGFQTHSNLSVAFEQITTIVGPTDSGKSAALRALGWCLYNVPRGESFINWDSEAARVAVQVGNYRVTRERGKDLNRYSLEEKGVQDILEFKAFGHNVPEEIQAAVQMSENNFQGQHDSVFWFAATPGEVARNLNAIINLDSIDDSLKYLGDEARKLGRDLETLVDKIDEEENNLQRFENLPKMRNAFDWMVSLDEEITDLKAQDKMLRAVSQTIDEEVAWCKQLEPVVADGLQIVILADEIAHHSGQLDRIATLTEGIARGRKRADMAPMVQEWTRWEVHVDALAMMRGQYTKIKDTINRIESEIGDQRRAKGRLEELEAQLKEVQEICPTCHRPL